MNNDANVSQRVLMLDRARLELDGVLEVESFTDDNVTLLSSLGNISVDGEELKIESFSSETGRLIINGKFDGFCYFGHRSKRRRFFSSGTEK